MTKNQQKQKIITSWGRSALEVMIFKLQKYAWLQGYHMMKYFIIGTVDVFTVAIVCFYWSLTYINIDLTTVISGMWVDMTIKIILISIDSTTLSSRVSKMPKWYQWNIYIYIYIYICTYNRALIPWWYQVNFY